MKSFAITAWLLLPCVFAGSVARADKTAVRKTLSDFVDVFNQKDASKVASFWTENATHTDRETGERTEGRDAIRADFAKVFSEQSGIKLTASADRVKFITPDVASVEGQTTVA